MKKINLLSYLLIVAVIICTIKPTKAQWATQDVPKSDNTLAYVSLGVSAAALIVILVIVSHNKHKKENLNKISFINTNDKYFNNIYLGNYIKNNNIVLQKENIILISTNLLENNLKDGFYESKFKFNSKLSKQIFLFDSKFSIIKRPKKKELSLIGFNLE